jgi:hypothetical protein
MALLTLFGLQNIFGIIIFVNYLSLVIDFMSLFRIVFLLISTAEPLTWEAIVYFIILGHIGKYVDFKWPPSFANITPKKYTF